MKTAFYFFLNLGDNYFKVLATKLLVTLQFKNFLLVVLPPTWIKLNQKTQCSTSSFTEGFNPSIISGNYTDPVSRTLGPSYKPNFCLITVVVVGFNSLWIKYDPVYDMNPSHFSTDVPHSEALAFSQSVWWKGAQAGTQSPWVFTKGWGEGVGGAVWMDRSNCRAGRSPSEAGREMKDAQMSLWWTSRHSAAFKRREHNATHVRMSWLLKIS